MCIYILHERKWSPLYNSHHKSKKLNLIRKMEQNNWKNEVKTADLRTKNVRKFWTPLLQSTNRCFYYRYLIHIIWARHFFGKLAMIVEYFFDSWWTYLITYIAFTYTAYYFIKFSWLYSYLIYFKVLISYFWFIFINFHNKKVW